MALYSIIFAISVTFEEPKTGYLSENQSFLLSSKMAHCSIGATRPENASFFHQKYTYRDILHNNLVQGFTSITSFVLLKNTPIKIDDKIYVIENLTNVELNPCSFTMNNIDLQIVVEDRHKIPKMPMVLVSEDGQYHVSYDENNKFTISNVIDCTQPFTLNFLRNVTRQSTSGDIERIRTKNSSIAFLDKYSSFFYDSKIKNKTFFFNCKAVGESNSVKIPAGTKLIQVKECPEEEIDSKTSKILSFLEKKQTFGVDIFVDMFGTYSNAKYYLTNKKAILFRALYCCFASKFYDEIINLVDDKTKEENEKIDHLCINTIFDIGYRKELGRILMQLKTVLKHNISDQLDDLKNNAKHVFDRVSLKFIKHLELFDIKKVGLIKHLDTNSTEYSILNSDKKVNSADRWNNFGNLDGNNFPNYFKVLLDDVFHILRCNSCTTEECFHVYTKHNEFCENTKVIDYLSMLNVPIEKRKLDDFLYISKYYLKELKDVLMNIKDGFAGIKSTFDIINFEKKVDALQKTTDQVSKNYILLKTSKKLEEMNLSLAAHLLENDLRKAKKEVDVFIKTMFLIQKSRKKCADDPRKRVTKIDLKWDPISEIDQEIEKEKSEIIEPEESEEYSKTEETQKENEKLDFCEIICIVCGILLFLVCCLLIWMYVIIFKERRRNFAKQNVEI